MNALAGLTYNDNAAAETDSVGGNFTIFESGIYNAVLKLAYLQNAASATSQAVGVNCTFDIGGKEYKETFWVTGRDGSNVYVDRQSGDKKYLGGFIQADAISLLGAKKELAKVDTEVKMIKLYNKEAGTDVPTKVEVLTDLLGIEVKLGIQKQLVFKQKKNEAGKWIDTEETRDENVVDKVFRASDSKTTAEVRAQAETAEFHKIWSAKWDGQVKDRTKGKTKKAGTAGLPAGATPASKPTSNLFDD